MKLSELALQLRGMIRRGVVTKSDDTGESQTASGKMYKGHDFENVEVLYPSGFASHAEDNGLVILLGVGGDGGDLVALPVASPGNRLGKLEKGEVAIFNVRDGSRVHIKRDGTIHAWSTKRVLAEVGDNTIDLTAELIRARLGDGEEAPRLSITEELVKLRIGPQWIALVEGGIFSSVPIVVGADPDPQV